MTASRPIVVTLSPAKGGHLYADLSADSELKPHPNTSAVWSFRGEGVTVSFYASGKLVVQGAGAEQFAARRLESGPAPRLQALDTDLVGTDESGKGDYFGPLVVAAVHVPKGQEAVLEEIGARDSKLVSDEWARSVASLIRQGYEHEVVVIGPERYNEIYPGFGNLNRLLGWATAKAIAGVLSRRPCGHVLSDKFGNERHIAGALAKMGVKVHLEQRVRAEVNPAVAAASLLARDRFLRELTDLGREIGVHLPKGAGPPVDVAARKLFAEGGIEALRKVAKLHFKTTDRITGTLF